MTVKFSRWIGLVFLIACLVPVVGFSQGVREFVDKTSVEKISKSVTMAQKPVTAGGFSDGHGRNPVLTSKTQIPDTVGVVSFYINDVGTVNYGPYSVSSYWISPDGGNTIANKIEEETMQALKDRFREAGIVLLTPKEYLNTPAKHEYYYNTFKPKVSKLAKFLSNIETKHVDTSVGADYYRPFDISVAWDAIRAESLIDDLGKNIGLKGLLTVAVNLQTDNKSIYMHGMRLALNGPNPIPKEDKKYVAQNMGNGYYFGQIYFDSNFSFPKPVLVGKYVNVKTTGKKSKSTGLDSYEVHLTQSAEIGLDVDGLDVIAGVIAAKSLVTLDEAIADASKKYKNK